MYADLNIRPDTCASLSLSPLFIDPIGLRIMVVPVEWISRKGIEGYWL